MKWKTQPQTLPQKGDRKTKIRLAWLPKRTDDGFVWLSFYEILYIYVIFEAGGNQGFGKWIEAGTRILNKA